MKARILLLLATIFSLLQGPFLPSVFAEGFFVAAALLAPRRLALLFLTGFLFDLLQGVRLGVTSILFLVVVFGASAVKGGLFGKPQVLAAVVFLTDIVRARLLFGEFLWVPAAVAGGLTFLFLKFAGRPSPVGLYNDKV